MIKGPGCLAGKRGYREARHVRIGPDYVQVGRGPGQLLLCLGFVLGKGIADDPLIDRKY